MEIGMGKSFLGCLKSWKNKLIYQFWLRKIKNKVKI